MADVLTVSQLADHLTVVLRADELLADVTVVGEISNSLLASSGHFYFSLKDANATLSCVMWRSAARTLFQTPQEGQRVVVHARVDFYAPRGQIQLIVDAMRREAGIGDLYLEFEQTKARLQAEGLFDAARKRRLPVFPRRIGLVTSPVGAALRDFLRIAGGRWPIADVLLAPSLVQGDQAPASLQAALYALYARQDVDVIVLARGGGSIEDLWAFNDEGLARLIAQSPVPVVTGIGHETDFTIADFVADQRQPTPSAAAAAVTPDGDALRQSLDAVADQITARMRGGLDRRRQQMQQAEALLLRFSPRFRIDRQRQTAAEMERRLTWAWSGQQRRRRQDVQTLHQRLAALNPGAVLARGYAIVQSDAGHVIQSVDQVQTGDPLTVRVADGAFPVLVRPRS